MTKRTPPRPYWWKNSFFWLGGVLVLLALWGLMRGEDVIRDPGQVVEHGLVGFYFLGAVIMLVNGWLTHAQANRHYEELFGQETEPEVAAGATE